MKKQLLCAFLCASMLLTSSITALAAKTEEPTAQIDGFAMVKVVDKKGKPVQGLSVSDSFEYIFTDRNGLSDIDVGAATGLYDGGYSGEVKVDSSEPVSFAVTNTVNGDTKKYNVCLDDLKTTKIVWNKETPAQTIAKKKKKIYFRVVDQNGKAVPDAKIVLPSQQILLPTNTSGKTYYYGEPFEKYSVELHYKDAKGNNQYVTKIVTVRDKHLKHGKMGITFKVKI